MRGHSTSTRMEALRSKFRTVDRADFDTEANAGSAAGPSSLRLRGGRRAEEAATDVSTSAQEIDLGPEKGPGYRLTDPACVQLGTNQSQTATMLTQDTRTEGSDYDTQRTFLLPGN